MKSILFLLPLAAFATANPSDAACDPRCDPKNKPKAQVAVIACDPVAAPVVVRGGKCTPARAVVSVNGQGAAIAGSCATAPVGGVSGSSSCCTTGPAGGVSVAPSGMGAQGGTVALAPAHATVHAQGVAVVAPQCATKSSCSSAQAGTVALAPVQARGRGQSIATTVAPQGSTKASASCGATLSGASASCGATLSGQGVATPNSTLTLASATGTSEPATLRVEGQGGLTRLVDKVRVARAQGQDDDHDHVHVNAQGHDGEDEVVEVDMEEIREEIEEALAEARESTREALEDAREAQTEAMQAAQEAERDARERSREAQQDAMERGREAAREARERTQEARRAAQEASRDAAQRLREAQFQHHGNAAVEEETRRAMEQAQQALAEVDWSAFNDNAQMFDASDFLANLNGSWITGDQGGLEERIRALERLAREQGHDTGDGSLEDRVAALERALKANSGRKSAKRSDPNQVEKELYKVDKEREKAAQVYKLGKDGKLSKMTPRELPRAAPRARRPAVPAYPRQPGEPGEPGEPGMPGQPSPPTPPSPFQGNPPGHSFRFFTPDGMTAPTPIPSDERRRIEEAMKDLRAEADALRTELQRMREQLDSLPRGGAR